MNFLKIQTPSNKIINIDLNTTETDLIKLLACLANTQQEKIKGLRDNFGNYFTLYSALYNPQGNFNYLNIYSLLCSNDNANQNFNFPVLDRFENFPDNNIPNSFTHDSNNYFKRKNYHNITNIPIQNQILSGNPNPQVNNMAFNYNGYYQENQSPVINRTISNNLNFLKNSQNFNEYNQSHNPNIYFSENRNPNSPYSVNKNIDFYNDSRYHSNRSSKLTPNEIHQFENFENFNRFTKQSYKERNKYSNFNEYNTNNDSDLNELNNYDKYHLEKNQNFSENFLISNNQAAFHKNNFFIPNQDYKINNKNIKAVKNKEKIKDFQKFNLDHLKRNLIPDRNSNNSNYFTNEELAYEKFMKSSSHSKANPSINYSEYTNISNNPKNYDLEFRRNQLSDHLYENSNNLKILKERKKVERSKLRESTSSSNRSRDMKQLQIEKYLSIANDIIDLNLIDDKFLPKLKQLILNENEDISTIFKFFCQDVIDISTLVSGVNKILSWTIDKNRRPDSPELLHKNQLVKLIDSLNESIFDDPADHILLRNLANYENDFILAAYELYLSDHDIENFIDSVKRFINKYNRPANSNNYNAERNLNKDQNNNKDHFTRNFHNYVGGDYDSNNSNNFCRTKNNPSLNIANLNNMKKLNKEFRYKINVEAVNQERCNPQKNNRNCNDREHESEKATKEETNEMNNNLHSYNMDYQLNNLEYQNLKNYNNSSVNNNNNYNFNNNKSNYQFVSQNNQIPSTIPTSHQTKEISNINPTISEIKNNFNNNQLSSFHSPTENLISTFNASNNTLYNNKNNTTQEIMNSLNNKIDKTETQLQNSENKNKNNNDVNSNQNKNNSSQTNNLNSSIPSFENLLKFLHTEQRIIFKYAIKNKLPEINIFAQLHSSIDSEDILLRTVKQFCKQFISDKITKYFDEELSNAFKDMIAKRDQNLLGFFKDFNRHNSIEKLQADIVKFLKEIISDEKGNRDFKKERNSKNNNVYDNSKAKENTKNENVRDKKKYDKEIPNKNPNDKYNKNNNKEKENKSFASSDSDENIDNNDDSNYNRKESGANHNYLRESEKYEDSENENHYHPKRPYDLNADNSSEEFNKNYKLSEFLKLINNVNFLNKAEKQLIQNLINEKNSEAIEIFEIYLKSKNILAIKSSIKSLLKKYSKILTSKPDKNNDLDKRNSLENEKQGLFNSNKKGGEILSKLEKMNQKQTQDKIELRKNYNNKNNFNFNINKNNNEEDNDSETYLNSPNKKSRGNNNKEQKSQQNQIIKKVPSIPINKIQENQAFNNNENHYDESVNLEEANDEENSDESDVSLNTNSKKQLQENLKHKKSINIENKTYDSLDELLQDLEDSQKISSHQHKYIIQRFNNKDDILMSSWEVYSFNKHLPDLIESLRIFSTNVRRQSNVVPMEKTPVALARSKNDIMDFLKSKDTNREKEEIKKKQLNIIEILVKEKMLDKNTAPIINQMIFEENHFLISAFEIFSVSKDHWEFVETLGMITDIYFNDGKRMSKSSNSLEKVATVENKDSKLAILFENFIKNHLKKFTDKEIDIFRKKLFTKDDFFMSALEFYEINSDQDEFIENLQQVLK